MKTTNHTAEAYDSLRKAYDFFNKKLFAGQLPSCLITLQRKSKSRGYFANERFGVMGQKGIGQNVVTDEIALNPAAFAGRTTEDILSTLVHEMVHLWQFRFGKPPRKAYHDRQWANKMKEVGLYPSHTGLPGGKEIGQKMTHYIIQDSVYTEAFSELKPGKLYEDIWLDKPKPAKNSKTKFTCDLCGANAWGKPELHIICADCDAPMMALS